MARKHFPAFREEDQHMAHQLVPLVVGPGAYTSPDPATEGNRLKPVDQHPRKEAIGPTYGQGVTGTRSASISSAAVKDEAIVVSAAVEEENRDEWTKADWKEKAAELGISTTGSKAELRDRVEEAEGR